MKNLFFAICLSLIYFSATQAQSYHLSLEESIEIAKNQSFEIQSLLQEKIIAENELKTATSFLRTNVSMNFMLPQYTESIREREDSTGIYFFPLKTLRGTGALNLSQPLPTDGRIYLSSGLQSINDYNSNRRLTTINTLIGLSQPLNSFWGYNAVRSDLKRARLNYERANKAFKRAE